MAHHPCPFTVRPFPTLFLLPCHHSKAPQNTLTHHPCPSTMRLFPTLNLLPPWHHSTLWPTTPAPSQ
ncbi:hypothetical protein E2C01_044791 [Portunus trituberculatus]|uniref:Uncharacterized protein n=1 Tax=Portunus trituberculatus TaxID=210409 RepID=A0A5B7FZB0_PORTR|nr:hypothetical protein [Portunus trituberculatus]